MTKGRVILIHSYKGGTGKSSIALNLGQYLTKQNKKVLIIEQDVSGPSFQYVFPEVDIGKYWNSFYNKNTPLKDLISTTDVGMDVILAQEGNYDIPADKGPKLFFGRHLERLNQQKKWLTSKYDYILLDTHPGYNFELINSILIADIAILLTRLDFDTVVKTIDMYEKLYAQFKEKKIIIVQNQVPKQVIEGIDLENLDIDVQEALEEWKKFTKDKDVISIPLNDKIAYALFKSKIVKQDSLLTSYIEELANKVP